jgi:HJR/Mrr/RecB family endonuclease
MNNHSPGNVDLWFVTEDDVRNAANGIPFEPGYSIYAYFWLRRRLDENTMEGWIGRIDKMENFHSNIDISYTYFGDYRANRKIYVTLDKTAFFEIDEIFPSKPLLFLLKRIKFKSELKPTVQGLIPATVHRLPFYFLGGDMFEHLVFAFLQQTEDWKRIEWLGETGQDQGKDIWAEKDSSTYCFQCANYQQLTFQKITQDIDKLIRHQTIPDYLIIVCGGKVTSGLKQKAISYCTAKGIKNVCVWSGSELEEKIRKQTPGLVQRFFEGNPFPQVAH